MPYHKVNSAKNKTSSKFKNTNALMYSGLDLNQVTEIKRDFQLEKITIINLIEKKIQTEQKIILD